MIGLAISGNVTESLVLLRNVKAIIIENFLMVVLTPLINSGQPFRNFIPRSYHLFLNTFPESFMHTPRSHVTQDMPYIKKIRHGVRAYGFYLRVVKYNKTNERGFASE